MSIPTTSRDCCECVRTPAERVTLYYCEEDRALWASSQYHARQPGGVLRHRVGQALCVLPQIENIDANKANTTFIGHSYFVDGSLRAARFGRHRAARFRARTARAVPRQQTAGRIRVLEDHRRQNAVRIGGDNRCNGANTAGSTIASGSTGPPALRRDKPNR